MARRRVSRYRDAIKRKEARRQAEIQTAIQTRRLAERKIAREREIRIARHEARRRNALILIATAKEAKEAGEKKQALLAAAEEKEQVRAKQKRTTIRAATLIQTVWRGRQSRKATQMAQLMAFIAVKAKKDEERAVAEHLVAQAEAMLFAAATAKLKEAENREAAKLREAQEAEDRAAMEFLLAQAETEFFATIAIQALWRGRMARSQLTSYLRSCPSPSTSCPSPAIQAHAMFSAAMTEDEAPKNYDSSDEAPKPAPPAYDDSSSSTSLNSASRTKALVKATKRQARRAAAKTTAHHHGLNPTLDEKLVAASKMRRNQETVGIPLTCSINEDGLETSTDVKTILVDFYQKHNPSKIDSIDATLKKFAGKELELFSRLAAKYRVVEKSAAAKKKKNEKSLDPVLASYRQYADTLSDTSKSSGGESAKAQEQLSVLSSFCSCPTNNPESDGSSSADKKLVEIKNSITSSTSSLTTSLTAIPAPRGSLSLVEATKHLTASASSASVSKLSTFEAVGTKSNTPRPKNNVSALVGLWNEKIQNTFTR
ncbi:hypothetical protein TL16_g01844 [Triparma laevis f. inornata]|uniref:Uncharacterized protein n=1 Tax=Triparma laevis f. inornata TaxID=1714386 RepID=A0A9W7DYD7_9STRA|nr:hypothetical protein TL16_g01844 [Triparma laevis f. inornata]